MKRKIQRHILVSVLLFVLSISSLGSASAVTFPERIPLPDGFRPEGIASGNGTTFYVGSIPTGAIYRGDFRTGEGEIFVEPEEGRSAIGLKYDPSTGSLFVAGGNTGKAFVYDAENGDFVVELQLSTDLSFINDVVITQDAAYFTNSLQPEIYRVPLDDVDNLSSADVETIPLSGDYQQVAGFNANGITATPNGKSLIVVNTSLGTLYQVDPETGSATLIDLGGGSVPNGDGILLHGKTLYVVQNQLNQIAVIKLSPDLSSGTIETWITSTGFRVPTTIALFGNTLYAVNARFGAPQTPETDYEVVAVPRK